MLLRNLLFLGLVGGGVFVLVTNLMPPRKPKLLTRYDNPTYHDVDFRATVARVDATFRQSWKADNLTPANPADDLIVARRIALGLMGTVPSVEEIRQFEALPPNARLDWWLDHVLADRRSADFVAERLARAYVGTEDGPFVLFRRRRLVAWLSDQVAANRPYDDLARDLISDRGLWTDRPATNFVSVTAQNDQANQPDPVRLAGRVTRAFLGFRLDCAQCHNHPFAEWKQADFEGFSAFFGQTHIGFTGVSDGPGEYEVEDRKTQEKKVVAPRVPYGPELVGNGGTRREQLAHWVTHPKNPYFARAIVNRTWALLFGRPLVEPIDNLESVPTFPPAMELLAEDFTKNGHDLRRLIRVIANTEAFRLDSVAAHAVGETEEKAWAVFPLTRLRPEQVSGSALQAASITTVDAESHILVRLMRYGQQNEFLQRYGDGGADEFDTHGGTIPQRLLMMNGRLVRERIEASPLNATTRIAWMAPDDPKAVEVAYLAVLSRRPTADEAAHFERTLKDESLSRAERLEDLYWALLNSTEFSWNH
jgi:hypothetical protein